MDKTSLTEINDSNKLVDESKKDKDWPAFEKSFTSLNSTLHFPNDPYFNCISANIPLPKLENFVKPYDIMNSCKSFL